MRVSATQRATGTRARFSVAGLSDQICRSLSDFKMNGTALHQERIELDRKKTELDRREGIVSKREIAVNLQIKKLAVLTELGWMISGISREVQEVLGIKNKNVIDLALEGLNGIRRKVISNLHPDNPGNNNERKLELCKKINAAHDVITDALEGLKALLEDYKPPSMP